ncbi:uncharacterized protein LOC112346580 [Selaginella moellendorffii]|uniref:uncharacterized protein LOC112346580 n=1 Tax=Selaginella moellendorffii TaxID=88036 RepID=UPI000D1CDEB9|nr:uncharacterized protein LOC112346580 [Selaginella moellendorffii]|eukprot:XP_024531642.1 uncharacterized protein LOC112346580 [Selaginella moellendorffii]
MEDILRLLFLACNQHALYCSMWKQIQNARFPLCTLPVAALRRLAHVLDRVKEFLGQCSHKEHWEWIATSRYDRRWEVVELLSELQECVDIINSDAIRTSSKRGSRICIMTSTVWQTKIVPNW